MTALEIISIHSPVRHKETPVLSVLIPFYRDNPSELIAALSAMAGASVEVLIYDGNKGRAYGRNFLFDAAKADWVLFLDADMMPISEAFLENYITLIHTNAGDVIFGGFKVLETKGEPQTELHRVMSLTSDCASAAERQRLGPKNVASSNLCVRKAVLTAEPFDNEFKGWGWEDSEWAARIASRYTLLHADNPALHLGLESTDTLLKRFKTSGANYSRFTNAHPELARSLPLYKWIQRLQKIPGHALLRPILKPIVKLNLLPINLRITALKLWRASWYAETVS